MLRLPVVSDVIRFYRGWRVVELFEIVRRDGYVLRVTSSPTPIDRFNKRYYSSQFGRSGSERRSAGFKESRANVTGFVGASPSAVRINDISIGRYKGAQVTWRLVPSGMPWVDLDRDVKWVREIQHDGQEYVADLQGIGMFMQRQGGGPHGGIFAPLCRASLGDSRCKKDISAWVKTGLIVSVVHDEQSDIEFTGWTGTYADNFYAEGEIEWLPARGGAALASGTITSNATSEYVDDSAASMTPDAYVGKTLSLTQGGITRYFLITSNTDKRFSIAVDERALHVTSGATYEVRHTCENAGSISPIVTYVDSTKRVGLYLPTQEPIAVNDRAIARPGCNGLLTTCVAQYANGNNFRGSPLDPGAERMHEPARDL